MDLLARIIDRKQEEIAAARRRKPVADLLAAAEAAPPVRSFLGALSRPLPSGVHIIAEIKRASPSKGDIRIDSDAGSLAGAYEAGGAQAVSVLTDGAFFKGSEADLKAARAAISIPVMRKDFILTEYQVTESRAMGADALLLIVRVLSRKRLKALIDYSRDWGMEPLVETRNGHEIETALSAGARVIGINSRNLATFETDLGGVIEAAATLPPGGVGVAESGIKTAADIRRLKAAGISCFLIGETLVRAKDPGALIRTFTGED